MPQTTYTLLDFARGERLEQWGPYRLVRPDPTAQGEPAHADLWKTADAVYEGEKGKGSWTQRTALLDQWPVAFDDLQLVVRLAPYKHTGVFPEQQQNWRAARDQAKKSGKPLTVLNLFAYTGGATMALAKDGHFVTHVDASKPAIAWAKENQELNGIAADRVRWMLEDAPVFAAREQKRGKTYDAIILDPPAYGHSPSGKTWRVERDLKPLLENCCALLSAEPSFLLLNTYGQNDTPESLHRLMTGILRSKTTQKHVHVEARELTLHAEDGRTLSTGTVAFCTFGESALP
ncbi:MAG: class I SAM-dependent methyltransferase [Candidatus Peregrinibacteria bacterium]|nr:class I SAM-dependent methyltransferase [Candidatus Peregrinibacteria bacterium]